MGDSLVDRMIRAAKLDVALYEEVEADTMATNPALMVVLIAAAAAAISGAIGGLITGGVKGFLAGLVLPPIGMVVGYYLWAYLTYYIGVNFFGGTADLGEMLRTIGFAHTPRVLGIVGFIPCLGWIISFIGSV